jgi:hypothetical protein
LTEEQSMFMHMGGLVAGYRGETEQDTERRLFGTAEAAGEAWRAHCDELLAEFPTAGRRIYGFWRYRIHRDPPPFEQQADLLRQLGELSAAEEEQLEEWRRMTPEPPADLALDYQSTRERRPPLLILEVPPHAIDALSESPRPAITEAAGGSDAPSEDPEAEDPAEEDEPAAEHVVRPPKMLSRLPWPLEQDRREREGWE